MNEFRIVNKKTIKRINKMAKEIGISPEAVQKVVKKWFEQHPIYNEDNSVDIDATTDVENMPSVNIVRLRCFPDYASDVLKVVITEEDGQIKYNMDQDQFVMLLDYISKLKF